MNINKLKSDGKKEVEGTWIEYVDGASLLIAKYQNRKHKSYARRLVRENQRALNRKDEKADYLSEKLQHEAVAHTVLLGWKGITESDEPSSPQVPYSPGMAIRYFEEMPKFFSDVIEMADDEASFKNDAKEEIAKNS